MHGDLHPGNILVQNSDRSKLVFLDCGIATSLGPKDWENLHCVFMAIVRNEGKKIADLMLRNQHCSTLQEYRTEMATLVDKATTNLNLEEVCHVCVAGLSLQHYRSTSQYSCNLQKKTTSQLFLYVPKVSFVEYCACYVTFCTVTIYLCSYCYLLCV